MDYIDWQQTIHSDGSEEFVEPQNPKVGQKIKIRLRIYKDHPLTNIYLRCSPEGEEYNYLMHQIQKEDFFVYYEIELLIISKIFHYSFLLFSNNKEYFYNSLGLQRFNPPNNDDFIIIADFENPTWVKSSIFYQIFPDRFYDGNSETNVKTNEYIYNGYPTIALPWGEKIGGYNSHGHIEFFGGDLEGIRCKIPYLKELGITAIYLNPIFEAPSNHKYDTMDYKKIDPHFGTNEEFVKLVQELHANNIKVILDGVFNHVGAAHYWFNKSGFFPKNIGAYNNPESKYKDFFIFHQYPDNYHSWLGIKSLPKLNYKSQGLRDEIYRNSDSVARFWLNAPYNIDGWRLDVANMVARQGDYQSNLEVWEEFRKYIKKDHPLAYIMGEHFFDATDLLDGNHLDAIMNYRGFYTPLRKWITQSDVIAVTENDNYVDRKNIPIQFHTQEMDAMLTKYRVKIPFQIQLLNYNLLDCHDLPRLYTIIKKNFSKLKIALIFLFTYIGVPGIYYGDEIGLEGEGDPDCRRCMIWTEKEWNKDILTLYKKLIALRKYLSVLQEGSFKVLYLDENIYCFSRFLSKTIVITIMNNSDYSKLIEIPIWRIGSLNDLYYNFLDKTTIQSSHGVLNVSLKSFESMILTNTEISILD